jgi:hypothetical protein
VGDGGAGVGVAGIGVAVGTDVGLAVSTGAIARVVGRADTRKALDGVLTGVGVSSGVERAVG